MTMALHNSGQIKEMLINTAALLPHGPVNMVNSTKMPSASKNLSTATTAELQSFLDSFDEIFCDCDGTLQQLTIILVN